MKTEVEKLSVILQAIMQEHNLEQHFEWPVPKDSPVPMPHFEGDNYQQNIYLKEHAKARMQVDNTLRMHYWLIQEWGGIKSFKKTPQNDLKIRQFLEQLNTGKPSSKLYDTLPSLSKVSSFLVPDEYVIYDARVVYSLNWLIFSHQLDMDFFPQPVSRNAQLLKFEQKTIFNLFHCSQKYTPKPQAYLRLCQLLKDIAALAQSPWQKPYEVEMLLFSIAPGHIVQDIQQRISIAMRV